jgi:hypothetical protein
MMPLLAILLATTGPSALADDNPRALVQVWPSEVRLHSADDRQRLVVSATEGRYAVDLTAQAQWSVADPRIARIDANGSVHGLTDGQTEAIVQVRGETLRVAIHVSGTTRKAPPTFEFDIQPILTAGGCNMGACHGKQGGQNGFALSLLGFDDEYDHAAIAAQSRGRRVFPAAPEYSLLLRKATATDPHGGGRRFDVGSADYRTLLDWIASGMPRDQADTPRVTEIELLPNSLILPAEARHQLIVMATYSDGSRRDVTHLAGFQSNESAVADIKAGEVRTGPLPGEATMMARFRDQIATCQVLVPLAGDVPEELFTALPKRNVIDGHVWAKLQVLGITPSERCEDHEFLRRASLDIIGRLPTSDEARTFLADPSDDKRERWIDHLLARPEYADFWANKWADLLRPNPYRVGIKATLTYDAWIRDAFRQNKPYDEFVRELVTASGSTWHNGAAVFFRERRSPDELTTMVSQLFLGIRLECAKCHHHPSEAWSQDDFYQFAAYFDSVDRKGPGISPPISGGEEHIFTGRRKVVIHPRTGEEMTAEPLFGEILTETTTDDPRDTLADWMTSVDNPYFPRVMANRVWADLMGRGLVEPVDDLRVTNPASNEALLTALADEFRSNDYDLKQLIRLICTSEVYQLSAKPTERNVGDTRNHSRHYRVRFRAEVLADALSDVTGVGDRFDAMPGESRASQIWTHRIGSLTLDTFGRPDLNQDPPCERTSEPSVVQALHLTNSEQVHRKITSDDGIAARLAASDASVDEITTEIYLRAFSRRPSEAELERARQWFAHEGRSRREATEDLLWAALNTAEFLFKN